MTPKEKAEEIVVRYSNINVDVFNIEKFDNRIHIHSGTLCELSAKQCALIAVDYLIKEQDMWQNGEPEPVLYWQEVKQEIEKL